MSAPRRPAVHVTPPRGWINDPNGLVHAGGLWHLFHQHFDPVARDGMCWGHATSPDLFTWTDLGDALVPDGLGQIWSGSAVTLAPGRRGPGGMEAGIAALFTYWNPRDGRQCQALATSVDGRVFAKHPANPVIPELRHLAGHPADPQFRDPKVFWHGPTERWVMVVAGGKLRLFTSEDLVAWRFEGVDESLVTECPDLFPLVCGGREHWVLSGGGRWYALGTFDCARFTPTTARIPMAHGPDFYATQTWSDAPGGRRVGISWNFSWAYKSGPRAGRIEDPFQPCAWSGGCLGLPLEMRLVGTPEGPRLAQQPVLELLVRRGAGGRIDAARPGGGGVVLEGTGGVAVDLEIDLPAGLPDCVLEVPALRGGQCALRLSPRTGRMAVDRTSVGMGAIPGYSGVWEAPLPVDADGVHRVRVVVDACSLEAFAGGGLSVLSAHVLQGEAPLVLRGAAGSGAGLRWWVLS